jgi:hypothetical protein
MKSNAQQEIIDKITPWLRPGDKAKIAKTVGCTKSWVSTCLNSNNKSFDTKVVDAAIEIANKNQEVESKMLKKVESL